MNRLFRIIKPILLYIAFPIVVAGLSFTNVGAEDETTAMPLDTSSSSIVEVEPELTYTYNEATGLWDSNAWYYDQTSGSYQPTQDLVEADNETVEALEPEIVNEETTSSVIDVDNTINSDATTGDALVQKNTEAGSALSGDAEVTATVLNNINSVTEIGSSAGGVASFSADVVGDVSGDIILQPIILQALTNPITANDTITNLNNVNSITNDINLNAISGDALVKNNTEAGDALTGSAETVANIINIINSMVVAGQSFVGAINIYGNFVGNILISPDFIPQLIDSNEDSEYYSDSKTVLISSSDTIDIINNLSLNAASGKALVANNTQAGNATTGDALTNIEIFNMTGRDIVASNCLLVFINVLGEWYGVIIDAPAGATTAMIGNGVESNNVATPNVNVSTDNKVEIINNITLNSQSGDASILNNTAAGNAVSGDATASVNLANIVGSRFSLSGWFGLLFINVFGKWFGNFGIESKPVETIDNSNVGNIEPVIEFIPRQTNLENSQPSRVFATINSDNSTSMPISQTAIEQKQQGSVLSVSDENMAAPIDYILMLIIGMLLMMMLSIV